MKHRLLILALLITTLLRAEDTSLFFLDKNVKKVNVQQMGLAPTTTLDDLLQLFPELMGKGASSVLENYAIKVDDQEVGEQKDVILRQLTIGRIKCLEIDENVSAAYAGNGATGSINIILMDHDMGWTGGAAVSVSTETNGLVSCDAAFRNDKLTVRAELRGDYTHTDDSPTSVYYTNSKPFALNERFHRTDNIGQMAKLYLRFTPTDKDELKLRLWQTFDRRNAYVEEEWHYDEGLPNATFSQNETDSIKRATTATVFLNYNHLFAPQRKLVTEFNYTYNGHNILSNHYNYSNGVDTAFYHSHNVIVPHSMNGKIAYDGALFLSDQHTILLDAGVKADFSTSTSTLIDSLFLVGQPSKDTLTGASSTLSVNPYASFTYRYNDILSLNWSAGYVWRRMTSDNRHGQHHLYNASFCLNITPGKSHTIRLNGARNFLAPIIDQQRGDMYFAALTYIYFGQFGEHRLNTDIGIKYARVRDYTMRYNVWTPHLSAFYQYRWFSLSLALNLFDNATHEKGSYEETHVVDYLNVRLTPIFRLPKQWQLSATLLYNSACYTPISTDGAYFYAALHVSKHIGNWSLNATFADPWHYRTKRTELLAEGDEPIEPSKLTSTTTAYPYPRYLQLGIDYRF